jgi:tetratricopeptide (TPR) repeat protein
VRLFGEPIGGVVELTKIVAVRAPERAVLDVVFLHGLDGDARKSWTSGDGFWPEWLADDVPGVAVWSVDYDAWSSGWRGRAMSMEDRAINVLAALQSRRIGKRPMVFVTHSMGGLIVKEALLYAAYGDTEFASFAPATKGVVFLGTPHNGAGLTKAVDALGKIYRGTAAVEDLRRNSPHLRQLDTRYRNWVHDAAGGVRHLVFFETWPTKGVHVVDEGSADAALPKVQPVGIDANHIGICKPENRDALVYRRVLGLVTDIVAALPPSDDPPDRYDVRVLIDRSSDGHITAKTELGGVPMGLATASWPSELGTWQRALRSPAGTDELLVLGHRLWVAMFDEPTGNRLVDLIDRCPVGRVVDVVVWLAESLAWLPVELLRLPDGRLLASAAGVSLRRRVTGVERELTGPLPGPLKILAAVAAPDETATASQPLDVEAEMQALLDAVTDLDLGGRVEAQVRILEQASLEQIRQALSRDQYHVLHLSAHGTTTSVELEDEDGHPHSVTAADLVAAVKAGKRPMPLIVLSSCHGATDSTSGLAVTLVRQGADRVIAMQASVTDTFATDLARELYRQMAINPSLAVGAALSTARQVAGERAAKRAKADGRVAVPEDAVPVLVTAGEDAPLQDPAAATDPLSRFMVPATGAGVRELPVGHLIGRRRQVRTAMAVLRRTTRDREEIGAWPGAVFTGIGGIGKTAAAGRVIARAREEGWLIAEHIGAWRPTQLVASVAAALPPSPLTDPEVGQDTKLSLVFDALRHTRLLVLFDDFEQNLAPDGTFTDPGFAELFGALCDTTDAGRILVTCRYPIAGTKRALLRIDMPPLSPAESRRLFLRLPAIRDLTTDQRRLITRMIGGHPRLIEFLDVLMRHGTPAMFQHVTRKLHDLADDQGIDLTPRRDLTTAITDAVRLGSRDILLDTLISQLTDTQRELALHAALARASATRTDFACAVHGTDHTPEQLQQVVGDVERLRDLTLLTALDTTVDGELVMHPWVADYVNHHQGSNLATRHEHNATMRLHRINTDRGRVDDIADLIHNYSGCNNYDAATSVALQTESLGLGQATIAALLADTVPVVPTGHPRYLLVADLECQALESLGLISSTTDRRNAMLAITQQRGVADPGNAQYQRDLSVSHNKLGSLAVAVGDSAAARQHFQASLTIREKLAAADPGNAQYQRDLSVCHNRLGDVAVAVGDSAAARQHYQTYLSIAGTLAAADPGNAEYQRDLSVSHSKLGDLAVGDTAAARQHYQTSLSIAGTLAAADPGNAQHQRDLSISHNKLGNLAVAVGDTTAARQHYQTYLSIAEKLAAADPGNAEYQRDLSVSHSKLGDLALAVGDTAAARQHYQIDLAIAEQLAAADLGNTQYQRDLGVCHGNLGDLAVAVGDTAAARQHYQTSLSIAGTLAAADPGSTEYQRDLSISHGNLGNIAVAVGDTATARQHYQTSLTHREKLAAADPSNAEYQRDLGVSHNNLGDLAVAVGDTAAARQHYQTSLTIREKLAAADPDNAQYQRSLTYVRARIEDL